MNAAICVVPVSPMRSVPSHRSEMVSQLLFGDQCEVMETAPDNWVRVKSTYDEYEGWCQSGQLKTIAELYSKPVAVTKDWETIVSLNGIPMHIPMGCSIPGLTGSQAQWGDITVNCDKAALFDPAVAETDEPFIRQIAFNFLNTTYLWGGRSVFGVDCSGFCQLVYKFLNIPLMRDAYQQATQGEVVGFLQEAKCGDLAFFDNAEGRITHVGILLNDAEIIHSSVKVRVDRIDNMGIINTDTRERTHKLRIIKRIIA